MPGIWAYPRLVPLPSPDRVRSAGQVLEAFDALDYLADESLATLVLLALRMRRPLFLEGEPGVGKTEVAKVLAAATGGRLIRLPCHEGIDAAQALYEWDHARQLLHLRAAEATGEAAAAGTDDLEAGLYQERFLVRRPLLDAITSGDDPPPVLLIDEIDRADDEFEAFLLEALSDWSVTVPELGTFTATVPPVVVITSNRTRDVHEALKRRCLYHWVDHPSVEREAAILRRRVPEVADTLAREVAEVVGRLRSAGLSRPPGVSESIDWLRALGILGVDHLEPEVVDTTLGVVVKDHDDERRLQAAGTAELLGR